MVTANDIRAIVEGNIEPSEMPETILGYLKARNGKTLTKRDEDKMREGIDPDIRISKRAGMTNIEWGGYGRTSGEQGGALLIAYSDGAPTIDADWVEKNNGAYFSARRARNEVREALLAGNGDAFEACAKAINAFNEAVKTIKKLDEYGQPLSHDMSAILRKFAPEWYGR